MIIVVAVGVISYLLERIEKLKKEIDSNIKHYTERIKIEKAEAIKKSKDVTRGQISEEFVPLFPDFPYNMSDCKFNAQPIDYIVFNGMSDVRSGKEVDIEIVFADVKTNTSKRSRVQNAIKKAILDKRVRFETWNIQENKKIRIK